MNPDVRRHRDLAWAHACLDLTDLGEAATKRSAITLCTRALARRKVAAVAHFCSKRLLENSAWRKLTSGCA